MLKHATICCALVFSTMACCYGQDTEPANEAKSAVSEDLLTLFKHLDELGREKIAKAKFVEVTFVATSDEVKPWTQKFWMIEQDDKQISVFDDDLVVELYRKDVAAPSPSSWSPAVKRVQSVKDTSFEQLCKELTAPKPKPDPDGFAFTLHDPGPSYRLLIAHAAWKHGLAGYCSRLVAADLEKSKSGFEGYKQAVLDDLAWLHFLRGVNLLMFADRSEVLPHLRLVQKLSPESGYAADAKELSERLEKMIAERAKRPVAKVDETKLTDEEKIAYYIAQLPDLHAAQVSQPGWISPYYGKIVDGTTPKEATAEDKTEEDEEETLPTEKLKELGMKAVPALIEALNDDTPTRTVYHWRDFARVRMVWRVSDFAWSILRDITTRDFGDRPVVGFTLSSMKADEKKAVIEQARKWYAENKDLAESERMFRFFESPDSDDWLTAGAYFLEKGDKRAVDPLLEKIAASESFTQGTLCELAARFGDKKATETLLKVLKSAKEPSVQISAAIGLWRLGNESGIPVAIEWVKKSDQPYGNWDDPIWFLAWSRSDKAIKALQEIVSEDSGRAGEVIRTIETSIGGNLWGQRREPAASLEIIPLLIAAMDRKEQSGSQIGVVHQRIKDVAASTFVQLRVGLGEDPTSSRFSHPDVKQFNYGEADEAKRDKQIDALKQWYHEHKDRLAWDAKQNKLVVKVTP